MITAAEREKILTDAMLGDVSAARFLTIMIECLHLWDDLIDKDKDVDDGTINRCFYNMLVLLPRNEFYNKHFTYLNPILVNAITNWHIATRMEREDPDEYKQRIAYILRSSYVDLTTQCAVLVGGLEYGTKVGYDNRLYAHDEGWDGYLANLAAEAAVRQNKE